MFTVAIWGMKHVPGHVQRLMEHLLAPTGALPYLDDIFRGSDSDAAHVRDMLQILPASPMMRASKLTLKSPNFSGSGSYCWGASFRLMGFSWTRPSLPPFWRGNGR